MWVHRSPQPVTHVVSLIRHTCTPSAGAVPLASASPDKGVITPTFGELDALERSAVRVG